ncbi:MAG: (Fe-S)-binding protein [Coriobacteriales bacterium]|nr:(Fe-S)-binding protein [Coriobacteriales bacterium]
MFNTKKYLDFKSHCSYCNGCRDACPSLSECGLSLGQIATAMYDATKSGDFEEAQANLMVNETLVKATRQCFLCGTCTNNCFAKNDVYSLMYAIREDLQNLQIIDRAAWSSVQVDNQWHIFSAYKAIYQIFYNDLIKHIGEDGAYNGEKFDVAFFPGCSLSAYAPELTREIFDTLTDINPKTTFIDKCCGSPLKSAGFLDRAKTLMDGIVEDVKNTQAKTVLCSCPGCMNAIRTALKDAGFADVKVITLAQYLNENNFAPKKDIDLSNIKLSKSCQDLDGQYIEDVALLLGLDLSQSEAIYGCCGAGGAVSAFNQVRQGNQIAQKLNQAQDGQTVVSFCPTCTYTFCYDLMQNPRNITSKNYLELIFENQIDWEIVFAQLGNMWSGEYAAWLVQELS